MPLSILGKLLEKALLVSTPSSRISLTLTLESSQCSQVLYISCTSWERERETACRQSRPDVWHEHPVALNPASLCCGDYSCSISIANKGIMVKFNQPSPPTLAHTGAMGEHEHAQPDWALIWLLNLICVNFLLLTCLTRSWVFIVSLQWIAVITRTSYSGISR